MGTINDRRENYLIENNVYIRDVTFDTEQTVAIPNPLGGTDSDKIDVQITQKGSSAVDEQFSFDFDDDNGEIDIHSTNASSTATVRVRVSGP